MALLIKFLPLLMLIGYGWLMWHFSARRSASDLRARSQPLRDSTLDDVLSRLAEAADVQAIPVRVYEVEMVNGLASPDGQIFLTRGFMQKYRGGEISAEELAAVIAHEMGHVALGHSRRRMIDFTGQNAAKVMLAGLLMRLIPGIGLIAPLIVQGLGSLVAARLSRRDEYEADEWASALLVKSGIGTAPQKRLFLKLERLAGRAGATDGAGGPAAWLLSHPPAAERIRAIEANEIRWGLPSE